jgi:choline dehydrogenase
MRACVRLTREIFAQPALAPYRGREIQPGDAVTSDAAIDQFIREKVESAYHPCGTCRMGSANDPDAVVTPDTKVIGVDGLRVVDASIMPTITNGNLNAPTIMLAEKAADIIRGRAPLPPSNAPYYMENDWQSKQR